MPERLVPNPRRVSLRKAAAHLGLDETTMRRLVQEGIVPAYRVSPTRIIVDLDEADDALRLIPKNQERSEAV